MAARIGPITFNYPGVYFELALPVPFGKQLLQNSANRNVSLQSENVHLRQKKRFMDKNDLWLIHTARDRNRVSILRYVLYTLHRDRDGHRESLFSIVPIQFLCPGPVQCV